MIQITLPMKSVRSADVRRCPPMSANPQAAIHFSHVTHTKQGKLANAGVQIQLAIMGPGNVGVNIKSLSVQV